MHTRKCTASTLHWCFQCGTGLSFPFFYLMGSPWSSLYVSLPLRGSPFQRRKTQTKTTKKSNSSSMKNSPSLMECICCNCNPNCSSSLLGWHLQGTRGNHTSSQVLPGNLTRSHCCHLAISQDMQGLGAVTNKAIDSVDRRGLRRVPGGFHLHNSQLEEQHKAWLVTQNKALDHGDTLQMLCREAVPGCNHTSNAAVTRSPQLSRRF